MLCLVVLSMLYDNPKDITDTTEEKFVFGLIVQKFLALIPDCTRTHQTSNHDKSLWLQILNIEGVFTRQHVLWHINLQFTYPSRACGCADVLQGDTWSQNAALS